MSRRERVVEVMRTGQAALIEGFEAARSVSIRGTIDRRIVEWVREGSGRQDV